MSIRMVKEKELESEYVQMAIKIMENGILINMAVERWNSQVVTVIGGNSRMVRRKDMEHGKSLVIETDSSGNTVMISLTGMEYTYGQVEKYITENTNRN